MRYTFKKNNWKYKEHFYFAWRPVFVQDGEECSLVFWEYVVRHCSGGGIDGRAFFYRELTKTEQQGYTALQGVVLEDVPKSRMRK